MVVTALHQRVAWGMALVCAALAAAFVLLGYTPDQINNLFPAALLATIGFFAVASTRGRPSLLLLAGIAGAVVSPLLWSAMPALLIPSLCCLYAFAKQPHLRPQPIGTTAGVVIVPLLLILGGVTVFLSGDSRQVCEQLSDGRVCSDAVETSAILRASMLVLLAAATGWWAATPRSDEASLAPQI